MVALAQRLGEGLGGAEPADAVVAHPLELRDDDHVADILVLDTGFERMLVRLLHEAFHALAMLLLGTAAILEQLLDRLRVLGDALGGFGQPLLELVVARGIGKIADAFFHLVVGGPAVGEFMGVAIGQVLGGGHRISPRRGATRSTSGGGVLSAKSPRMRPGGPQSRRGAAFAFRAPARYRAPPGRSADDRG